MNLATDSALDLPERVEIHEVGPRDGIQFLEQDVPTDTKIRMIDQLVETGLPVLEIASFVHPEAIPQMADARAVVEGVTRHEKVTFKGLVPNFHGAKRALETDLDLLQALVSCDNEFNKRNQNRSIDETISEISDITSLADKGDVPVHVIVALAFFTPGRGPTPKKNTFDVLESLYEVGIRDVQLALSMGMAEPRQIIDVVSEARKRLPELSMGLHVHNRNGFAFANVLAGLQAGIQRFETSVLGLGGDTLFPGGLDVMGNLPTEDLLHFLDSLDIDTGVELDRFLDATCQIESILGIDSKSYVTRGGSRRELSEPENLPEGSFSAS